MNEWVSEENPANKAIWKTIYEALTIRRTHLSARIQALEAKLSMNGERWRINMLFKTVEVSQAVLTVCSRSCSRNKILLFMA